MRRFSRLVSTFLSAVLVVATARAQAPDAPFRPGAPELGGKIDGWTIMGDIPSGQDIEDYILDNPAGHWLVREAVSNGFIEDGEFLEIAPAMDSDYSEGGGGLIFVALPASLVDWDGVSASLHTLVVMARKAARGENEKRESIELQVIKTVAKIVGFGSPIVCISEYFSSPPQKTEEWEERKCVRQVAYWVSEGAARRLDSAIGRVTEFVQKETRRAIAVSINMTVFQLPKDSEYMYVWRTEELLWAGRQVPLYRRLDAPARIVEGRFVIPLRHFEAGGRFAVGWIPGDGIGPDTATITRKRDGLRASFPIGSTAARLSDGTSIILDAAPFVVPPGRTMVPFRFGLGSFCEIAYYPRSQEGYAFCPGFDL